MGFDSEFGYKPELAVLGSESVTQLDSTAKEIKRIEYKETIRPGLPWADVVNPDDIFVPYGYRNINQVPWIAHRFYRPIEDVKADQKYKNTEELVGKIVDTGSNGINKYFGPASSWATEKKYAELYEIRDVKNHRVIVICEDEIIFDEDDVLQIEGLPYEFLVFNEDPEHMYGISDISILAPQQIELNDIRTQSSQHRQIALMKFLYKKGSLTETELDKLLSGDVGPAVEISNVDETGIQSSIQIMQPHVPMDFEAEIRRAKEDMKENLGFSDNQMGSFSDRHNTTMGEVQTVQRSTDIRNSERRDIIGDVTRRILRKWNQFVFSFWKEDRVIRVVGEDGVGHWKTYTGDELRGEYFLNLDIEQGQPISNGVKLQMATQLLQMFNGDQMVDQVKLRQILLRQFDQVDPEVPFLLLPMQPGFAQAMEAERQLPEWGLEVVGLDREAGRSHLRETGRKRDLGAEFSGRTMCGR